MCNDSSVSCHEALFALGLVDTGRRSCMNHMYQMHVRYIAVRWCKISLTLKVSVDHVPWRCADHGWSVSKAALHAVPQCWPRPLPGLPQACSKGLLLRYAVKYARERH